MKLSIALSALAFAHSASAFVPPSTTSVTRAGRLFMEPLAKEGDWAAYLDEDNTGLVYYFNGKTGESLWEPPTRTFPQVKLSKEKKRTARKKQQKYRQAEAGKDSDNNSGGFFSSVLSTLAEEEKQQEKKKEEPNWFDGMFDEKKEEKKEVVAKDEPKEEEGDEPYGFFNIFDFPEEEKPVKEKKTEEPQKEESSSRFFDIFGDTKQEEKKERKQKEEKRPAKVNGDASPFSLNGLVGTTKVAEKKPKEVKKEKLVQEKGGGGGFGFNGVMKVLKRSDEGKAAITPKQPIEMDVASFVLPHPAKVSWGGEDAAFVKGRTFGVFDGVSGADKLDGIPLYSKTLADELQSLVQPDEGLNTKELSKVLLEAAEFADRGATGASTAVVASVTKDGYLRAVNLGDSVCMLIRNGRVRAKTREIVHYFDCPYQLADDSPDRPKDATKLNIEVMPGDVIVMGSDGVFDNLDDKLICETLDKAGPRERSFTTAKRIVDLSRKVSMDKNAKTPYAKLARRNGDPEFKSGKGGKLDDISCVIARCS